MMFAAMCVLLGCPAEAVPDDDPDTITVEEAAEAIEEASDPEVQAIQLDAIDLITHLHGKEDVEAYRQQLIAEKAAEVAAQLEKQKAAEEKAKAKAIAEAEKEVKSLEAKIEQHEAAQDQAAQEQSAAK